MGNSMERNVNIRDVIVDDEITNYDDAKTVQFLHYKDQENSPNHLIGYKQNISFKITNYMKYDNGVYIYETNTHSIESVFGEGYTCDILNNIKIQNENVKMYIQIEVEFVKGGKGITIFEAENFEINYVQATRFGFITFIFVSKDIIVEEFNISATKYIAGPYLFRKYIAVIENPTTHIHITNGPIHEYAKRILFYDIIKTNFPAEPIPELTQEKIERFKKLHW